MSLAEYPKFLASCKLLEVISIFILRRNGRQRPYQHSNKTNKKFLECNQHVTALSIEIKV